MTRQTIASCLIIILAIPALALEYLPLEPGIIWDFGGGAQATVYEPQVVNGVDTTPLFVAWPEVEGRTYYLSDTEAGATIVEIMWHSGLWVDGQWILESYMVDLSTSFPLFTRPLAPGALPAVEVESSMGSHLLVSTVLEEQILSTPLGDLPVMPVELVDMTLGELSATFYLHREYGLVGYDEYRIEAIEGIVPVAPRSLSGIKALFH